MLPAGRNPAGSIFKDKPPMKRAGIMINEERLPAAIPRIEFLSRYRAVEMIRMNGDGAATPILAFARPVLI